MYRFCKAGAVLFGLGSPYQSVSHRPKYIPGNKFTHWSVRHRLIELLRFLCFRGEN